MANLVIRRRVLIVCFLVSLFSISANAGVTPGISGTVDPAGSTSDRASAIVMDAAGNSIVAWNKQSFSPDAETVMLRTIDATGALGTELEVSSTAVANGPEAGLALLDNGTFVVTWTTQGLDGDAEGIAIRRFDASANPLTDEVTINTFVFGSQSAPVATALPGYGFVVAWSSFGQDGDGWGVYARRFDADGNAIGTEFKVNTNIIGDQSEPRVSASADGSFVVAWDGAIPALQRFDANGLPIGSETPLTGTGTLRDVAMQPSGEFAVTRGSDYTLYAADGTLIAGPLSYIGEPQGVVTAFSTSGGSLVISIDGSFLVGWVESVTGTASDTSTSVYVRQISPAGKLTEAVYFSGGFVGAGGCIFCDNKDVHLAANQVGQAIQIHTTIDNDWNSVRFRLAEVTPYPPAQLADEVLVEDLNAASYFPALARNGSGSAVTVWQTDGQDGDGAGVFGRRIDPAGNLVGEVFQVNTTSAGSQDLPSVAMDDVGNFLVVWSGPDADGDGVYGRLFSAAGAPLGAEFLVNSDAAGWQKPPRVGVDANGNFYVVWYYDKKFFLRIFSNSGVPLGGDVVLREFVSTSNIYDYDVAVSDAGNTAVLWALNDDSAVNIIGYQTFDSAGMPLISEVQLGWFNDDVWSYTNSRILGVDINNTGLVAVSYLWSTVFDDGSSGAGISGLKLYDGLGNLLTSIASTAKGPVSLSSNEFAVLSSDLVLRRFDFLGTEIGSSIELSTLPNTGEAKGIDLVSSDNDLYQVVWSKSDATGGPYSIYMQRADLSIADADGDGIQDTDDNCPLTANPGQEDLDADGSGDACDPDIDGDGFDTAIDCNDLDNSIYPGAAEITGDGVDQDCNGFDLSIVVTRVRYSIRADKLIIEATSALGSAANLVVDGYGSMNYKPAANAWRLGISNVGGNPGTITVNGVEGSVTVSVQ